MNTTDPAHMYVWVKSLETKVNNLVRQMNVLKNDFIGKQKQLHEEMKVMNQDLLDLRHTQEKMQQQMDLIIRELQQTAGQDEVMSLRKYVDLWNPMHFVTQRDVERVVEAKLHK